MWLAYRGWQERVPVAERPRLERLPGEVRLDSRPTSSTSASRGARASSSRSSTASASSRTTSSTWFNDLLDLAHVDRARPSQARSLLAFRRTARRRLGARRVRVVRRLGLWAASMETLALMLAAVGCRSSSECRWASPQDARARFNRVLTPFLDAAQIVPAFAYLMPVVLFFSIGYAAAVVATMIYAIPPAIRITALGIRGVPVNTVEAAASHGCHRSPDAAEGPASAVAAHAPPRPQPDHPLRAVDGRHRGAHRRRRARRRRELAASSRTLRSRSSPES